jgi:hypothetical protein
MTLALPPTTGIDRALNALVAALAAVSAALALLLDCPPS